MVSLWFRTHSSSASPESGLGTSHTSLPGSGPGSASEQQNEEMYYEPEPLQPLCICKALYPFDGMSYLHILYVLVSNMSKPESHSTLITIQQKAREAFQ